jgi:hypothetical protein
MDPAALARQEAFFKTLLECKNSAALPGLLAAAASDDESVRLNALQALVAFKDQVDKPETLTAVFMNDIAALQEEPDVSKAKKLFETIGLFSEEAMPALVFAIKIDTWAIRYYAAEAIARVASERPAVMNTYGGQLRDSGRALEAHKDYGTALIIAKVSGLATDKLEAQVKSLARDINALDPSQVAIGLSLKDMTDKLGADYKESPSSQDSAVKYCHYPSLGLVFALRKAVNDEDYKIWGIGYVRGFKADIFGVIIGEKLDRVFMMFGAPPADMLYRETENSYSWFNKDRGRYIAFVLEKKLVVRYAAEIIDGADPRLFPELNGIMEAATVNAPATP